MGIFEERSFWTGRSGYSKEIEADTWLIFFFKFYYTTMNIFELVLHTFSATADYLLLRNIKDI